MLSWFGFIISCFALLISGATAWFTFFRKGKLLMTQPTVIHFGHDVSRSSERDKKIFLRTLLYSTAKRGHVLESLHISLYRNETKQNFNIWVYGEKGSLKRGSGLFIPQEGVTFDHHFLLPEDGSDFEFVEGVYTFIVYARLVGSQKPLELICLKLPINQAQASELTKPNTGIYFDWGPDQQDYYAHIDRMPEVEPQMEKLFEAMANKKMQRTGKPAAD